jgi:hypothetical protein
MKVKNKCHHCKKEFVSDCHQTFCPVHADMFMDGRLRMCDQCGETWVGECGYSINDEHGYPIELCAKCEKKLLEVK